MNPILLKPVSDMGSQVIVNGKPVSNMPARKYFANKKQLIPDIIHAFKKLEEQADIIVIEGAGSPAEINLKADDIVNMGLAKSDSYRQMALSLLLLPELHEHVPSQSHPL